MSLISGINGRTMHGVPGVGQDLHWRLFPAFLPLSKRHESGSFQEAAASPFSIVKFSLICRHITKVSAQLTRKLQHAYLFSIAKNSQTSAIMVGHSSGDSAARSVCNGL